MLANIQSIAVDKRKNASLQPALTSFDAFDFLLRWGVSNQANNIPATTSTNAKEVNLLISAFIAEVVGAHDNSFRAFSRASFLNSVIHWIASPIPKINTVHWKIVSPMAKTGSGRMLSVMNR